MMLINVSSIFTTNPSNWVWVAEASFLPVESSSDILLGDPAPFANTEPGFALDRSLKTALIVGQRCMMSMVFGADGFGSMRSSRVRFLPRIRSS